MGKLKTPRINVTNRSLPEITLESWAALVKSNLFLYASALDEVLP